MINSKKFGSGPLDGVRVVEFASVGPGPLAAIFLADMGAEVPRIERPAPDTQAGGLVPISLRGRTCLAANLKLPDDLHHVFDLLQDADCLVEGYRPGVMERFGLGPDEVLKRNPRLIYGRITAWGQTGPLAKFAAHDINCIAIGGALAAIGPRSRPIPPLNLIGDFGGGSLYLVAACSRASSRHGRRAVGKLSTVQ